MAHTNGIAYDRYFALGAVCCRFKSFPADHRWVAQLAEQRILLCYRFYPFVMI